MSDLLYLSVDLDVSAKCFEMLKLFKESTLALSEFVERNVLACRVGHWGR